MHTLLYYRDAQSRRRVITNTTLPAYPPKGLLVHVSALDHTQATYKVLSVELVERATLVPRDEDPWRQEVECVLFSDQPRT